ncbi:TIGR03759 family integrating conjugative element protein [Pseudomonas fluorescens]|uniref:TIGR03759 family integrating conjugative element protein n=1 Tax=Pseudomonas fluorescens TaxID=294 RepID=A0A944HB64_PSEFL|nr:TIGR03759 family integrating conjugative element protein [Pseudomonas fluorescens]MBT2298200.1 TIGR03759 family integrating conjugative element protein [Pseudomonas fluorescens]MBT2309677.1 TIGR03759 family integrating conjugative element protein [Pseudomonas fluorescens]MBT2314840.1 TIGR03759 family integrating conjugative element protein [Pseudomonas fluorescens]MBT2327746.1 TIGR03759 family integrating conjugative element protein [Pseudomonas fluorescens]MBT2345493.1 TIGR03759 family int
MNRALLPTCFCLASMIAIGSAQAEINAIHSQSSDTQSIPLEHSRSAQAATWGLSDQEWSRFEQVLAGPRGFWSPNLDPLTALGVEAESDQERQRYAELQVRLEAKRAERELAYQNAYTAAWAKLFPGLLPVQGMTSASPASSPVVSRPALFVEDNCQPCIAEVQRLQNSEAAFDIYLVGSQGKDERIRTWARHAGIDPSRVQRQQITLNHDRGHWFSLDASGSLPATFQQVNGQWQRLN